MKPENSSGEEINSQDIEPVISNTNIAEDLDEDILGKIGRVCSQGFEQDLRSRDSWDKNLEDWTKLAMQYAEDKSWPWNNAANVKYPLLSVAAIQFAARAYPALVPSSGNLVQAQVIGKDPTGEKNKKA
ncbi:MAG: hypothetical protein ACRDBG_24090, partial [Waterburya sp.]